MNLGRRVALLAGLPATVPGTTVNRFCASSLQTIRMAFHAIRADERLGEEVVVFVTVAQGADVAGEELVAFGKHRLGGYKYPREVHVLPALPLTPVGKADRKALRELLQTERSV